ncbi:hypothetical protein [uncultured Alistipes sp.]|jgi:hypothetical protein|uniref:hypothetical protein n=1 Tax=uncultured Alistipes sp. TaxID=538949 RepID=UPI0020501CA7|nr:hypothetical protein [uncultured Alistipes sp.]DAN30540.1 MAG TPA: hypothetical protein [Crassvirales sp.]
MSRQFIRAAILTGASILYICNAAAQEPPKPEAQLRFDQAQQEELAEQPSSAIESVFPDDGRSFAYKLNRKRTGEPVAYDAVTLWNVRKVKVKNRCMWLSDTTCRERARLLKFFTGRDRKKGVRPHLLGNVAGYTWTEGVYDNTAERWRKAPKHIAKYTLRDEYEAVRKAAGDSVLFKVPDELWHNLSPDAVYVLNGEVVPGHVFQFIDGLTLRTLEIFTGDKAAARYEGTREVVIGDTYPDRIPLVIFQGKPTTVESWLKMCRVDAFSMEAAVPMQYFYMQPVEAVQTYGVKGKYGAICINIAE